MATVGKLVALLGPKRSIIDLPQAVIDSAAKSSVPALEQGNRREAPPSEPAPSDSPWEPIQSCINSVREHYETACSEYQRQIASKDDEIARLQSAVDQILDVANRQQKYMRRADDGRAAKDQQIARLMQMVAEQGRGLALLPARKATETQAVDDGHRDSSPSRLARAA